MHVDATHMFELKITSKEFTVITKTLAGLKLTPEEKVLAANLNKHMLGERVRIYRLSLEIAEATLAKVEEEGEQS